MRYFRYNSPKQEDVLLKIRLPNLTKAERKSQRRAKWLHRLGMAVFWVIAVGSLIVFLVLFSLLDPTDAGWFSTVLYWIGRSLIGFVVLIVGAIVGGFAASPLLRKSASCKKQIRNKILQKYCGYLREFYGFREPFVVTKCYECTDRKFNRHDVCLFAVDGELRITANLHYGFFNPERDLGCYALEKHEITLCNTTHKDRSAVELAFGDTVFCLSRNAVPFLQEYLTESFPR